MAPMQLSSKMMGTESMDLYFSSPVCGTSLYLESSLATSSAAASLCWTTHPDTPSPIRSMTRSMDSGLSPTAAFSTRTSLSLSRSTI